MLLFTHSKFAHFRALNWHVHPPTAFCFARHLLHLYPPSASSPVDSRHDILELARFLTELSVIDYFFVNKKSSFVGLAALLNAMEISRAFPFADQMYFLESIHRFNLLNVRDPAIEECRFRLKELYISGGYSQTHDLHVVTPVTESRTDTVSPVSVTATFDSYTAQHAHASGCESSKSCSFQAIHH